MGVTVTGFKELDAQLDRLSKAAGKAAIRRALKTAGKPFADAAKAAAPYDGSNADKKGAHLRDTITISTKLNKQQRRLEKKEGTHAVKMFVGAGAPHAHLVEFGTRKSRPRPFLRPTWEAHKDQVLARLKEELWKEINKSIARAAKKAAKKAAKGG